MSWLDKPIKGLLLDISGVLKTIDGSIEAFQRLKLSKIPFRLCTNETQLPREALVKKLAGLNFLVDVDTIFSPAPAMAIRLEQENLTPHLLIHPSLYPEFRPPVSDKEVDCVVIGDAADSFSYEAMNQVFNVLLKLKKDSPSPKFYTLGRGKYYMEDQGLMLDVGAFTVALEYATGIQAELIGKPAKSFFQTALNSLGMTAENVVMIGDDIVGDVGGAQSAGLRGVLVRTGKFQTSDENHPQVTPDAIVNNLQEAIDLILAQQK